MGGGTPGGSTAGELTRGAAPPEKHRVVPLTGNPPATPGSSLTAHVSGPSPDLSAHQGLTGACAH